MPETRSVEYYRLWIDHTWDTDFIDIPADTPEDRTEEAIRKAVEDIDWQDVIAPIATGLYWEGEQEEEEEVVEEEEEEEEVTESKVLTPAVVASRHHTFQDQDGAWYGVPKGTPGRLLGLRGDGQAWIVEWRFVVWGSTQPNPDEFQQETKVSPTPEDDSTVPLDAIELAPKWEV